MAANECKELFEVIDGKGRKIGIASRSECHRKRLLHRSVHIFLFNKKGELFVQRRSMAKDLYPGKYTSSVSGHVDLGETTLQAAKRELKEELGISGIRLKLLGEFTYETPRERELSSVYSGIYEGKMKLNNYEVIAKDSGYFPKAKLRKIKKRMSPGFHYALKLFFKL